jgi:predicted DNA binding CopG/RHH family protein
MREELKKKTFKNEAEEAAWWDQHQNALADEFEKAAAAGTPGHGTAARKGSTPTTTIRLDPEDIARARSQAAHRGLRYQTYLKMLIHQALHQADTEPKARRSRPSRAS